MWKERRSTWAKVLAITDPEYVGFIKLSYLYIHLNFIRIESTKGQRKKRKGDKRKEGDGRISR